MRPICSCDSRSQRRTLLSAFPVNILRPLSTRIRLNISCLVSKDLRRFEVSVSHRKKIPLLVAPISFCHLESLQDAISLCGPLKFFNILESLSRIYWNQRQFFVQTIMDPELNISKPQMGEETRAVDSIFFVSMSREDIAFPTAEKSILS